MLRLDFQRAAISHLRLGQIPQRLMARADVVEGIGQGRVEEERSEARDRRSKNRQQDRVWKMQAFSGRLSKADKHQKSGDERREHGDTEHGREFRRLSGSG